AAAGGEGEGEREGEEHGAHEASRCGHPPRLQPRLPRLLGHPTDGARSLGPETQSAQQETPAARSCSPEDAPRPHSPPTDGSLTIVSRQPAGSLTIVSRQPAGSLTIVSRQP